MDCVLVSNASTSFRHRSRISLIFRTYFLRRSMSADAVSAHVVGAATHFIVTADEIFAPGVYQSRREAAAAN